MKKLVFVSSVSLFLVACNASKNQTNIELIQNMMDQPNIKSQDWDPKDPEKVQMRVPPPKTVSRGNLPYKYTNDPAGAEKDVNPLAGDMSPEVLTIGRAKYDIYCALCHGLTGNNDGSITPKMPVKPRLLLSDEAKAYSDGRIYYSITAGKGVMGSYQGQIPNSRDRWAIVNYVRSLQKQVGK
jgi:mono/diheme cytochrome c family protein